MAAQLTAIENTTCKACGPELRRLETQNRQLQERVELLFLEKSQLEAVIRKLRWERKGYLSKSKQYTPLLPAELWQYILDMATHFEGFVRSHWDQHTDGLLWDQSLSTRLSIPLVCRNWNKIGIRFLYERIVIQSDRQILPLKTILYGQNREYANFIFGLEISINPGIDSENAIMVFQNAADIIAIAPRLRLFGLETLELYNTPFSQLPILTALRIHQHQLEALHLPTHGRQASIWEVPAESNDEISSQIKSTIISMDLPKLKILSITPTEWIGFEYSEYTSNYTLLESISKRRTSLNTLSLDYRTYEKFRRNPHFVRLCGQLRVLHLTSRVPNRFPNAGATSFFQSFSLFQAAFPLLEVLTLVFGISIPENEPSFDAVHSNLQKIELLDRGNRHTYSTLGDVVIQIYKLVENGCLPKLRHVVYHRNYQGGLLDCTQPSTADQRAPWRSAMGTAKRHNILMSNSFGDPLRFWSDSHSIRPSLHYPSHASGQEDSNHDEEASDIESERTSSDAYVYNIHPDYYKDSGVHKSITDDSEDEDYRYKSSLDIKYITDSESDSEL